MSNPTERASRRVLEPYDRLSEVLFGLIMVLTFTGSLSISEAGRDDIRTMLIGALGCNLAWGIIDGVLYLMGSLAERARSLALWRQVCQAGDSPAADRVVAEALPPAVAGVLRAEELTSLRRRLVALPEPPRPPRLRGEDWRGALGVFLLVFLSTFPVVIPFLFMKHAPSALRISNAIAVAMLFATGFGFGRLTGRSPWGTGVSLVFVGLLLVSLTMALGG
jgi:hypothetical protein